MPDKNALRFQAVGSIKMRADRFYERTAVQNYDDDDDEEAPSWLKNLPPGSDIDIERIRWMGLSEGQRRMRT